MIAFIQFCRTLGKHTLTNTRLLWPLCRSNWFDRIRPDQIRQDQNRSDFLNMSQPNYFFATNYFNKYYKKTNFSFFCFNVTNYFFLTAFCLFVIFIEIICSKKIVWLISMWPWKWGQGQKFTSVERTQHRISFDTN